jgi:hypothetical protein
VANDVKFQINVDKDTVNFFQKEMPQKLKEARKKAVEAAGKVWADEAKRITRNDNHIVTGLYVNSIGYNTGSPASEADVVNEITEDSTSTTLETGSNVAYAAVLEKRYNIMGRALDSSQNRMAKVAETQVKKTLFG